MLRYQIRKRHGLVCSSLQCFKDYEEVMAEDLLAYVGTTCFMCTVEQECNELSMNAVVPFCARATELVEATQSGQN